MRTRKKNKKTIIHGSFNGHLATPKWPKRKLSEGHLYDILPDNLNMNTPATFNSFYNAIGPSLAADIPEMETTLIGPNRVSNTFVIYDIELYEVISTILIQLINLLVWIKLQCAW